MGVVLQSGPTGLGVREVRVPMGRIEVVLEDGADVAEVRERLRLVPGLANFSMVRRVEPTLEAITAGVLANLPEDDPTSFRVLVRRADKQFPMRSPDVERAVGAAIIERRGWHVDLNRPERVVGIEIVPGAAFFHFGKEPGAGGLPTGTGGKLVALLSGGIDSPVAAWRMMRRGCRLTLVHFHSYPFLSRASQDKARQLAARLARHQLGANLHMVPFGEVQRKVTLSVPGPFRTVIYRRLMMRIAECIARNVGAGALVTGDVIGQVASQTLENIVAIESAVSLPVFRPLIGMDKIEIMDAARGIHTLAISELPDEDCCTVLTPRRAETRAKIDDLRQIEKRLDAGEMAEQLAASAQEHRPAYGDPAQ